MLSGEATDAYFIVFGLTRLALEPTIYPTRPENANHYKTNVIVLDNTKIFHNSYNNISFIEQSKKKQQHYIC